MERGAFQRGRLLYQLDVRKSKTALDRKPFRRQRRGADPAQQAVFLFRLGVGADCVAHRLRRYGPDPAVGKLHIAAAPAWGDGRCYRRNLPGAASAGSVLPPVVLAIQFRERCSLSLVLGCPFTNGASPATGSPANGDGCAVRRSVIPVERRPRAGADRARGLQRRNERHPVVSHTGRYRASGSLYRSD